MPARQLIRSFVLVIIYALVMYLIQYVGYKAGIFSFYPNSTTIAGWDVAWYRSIAEKGYVYWDWGPCNAAFFILLPALWKLFHLSIWGVVIFNTILFATGFAILSDMLKAGRKQQLLFLTLPPVYFAFIPYTEALSFLLTVVCFYGVLRKKSVWVVVSIFLLSLTRVSAAFLVPSLLVMELLVGSNERWWPAVKKSTLLYLLPAMAGLALFVCYQYYITGIWFVYFKLQAGLWGHGFSIPSFPFVNISSSNTMLLSAFATVLCAMTIVYTLYIGGRWLLSNTRQQDKLWVLSLAYMSMALLLTVFFNPKWDGHTNVMGIYRYAICTPFFFVFLQQFSSRIYFKRQHYITIYIFCNLVLLLFRSYVDLRSFLYFNICSVVILLYMLNGKYKWISWLLIVAGIVAQALLFQDFLSAAHYPD